MLAKGAIYYMYFEVAGCSNPCMTNDGFLIAMTLLISEWNLGAPLHHHCLLE